MLFVMYYKKCTKCKTELPLTSDFFYKNKRNKDGYSEWCKKCKNEWVRENIDSVRKYRHKRRVKKGQLLNTFTNEEWLECLDFFNYKDAYTGLDLIDITQDHIIPVTKNGDYIKNNIVPCNRDINSSKGNNDLLEWYPAQDFFSEYRLKKILQWMGEYAHFLKNPKGISYENILNKKSQIFKIILPDGKKYTKSIYYFKSTKPKERIKILNNVILNKWENYFNEHWLDDKYKKYNSTKQILERCANFLLNGTYHEEDNKILSNNKIEKINKIEIPFSNLEDNDVKEKLGLTDMYGYSYNFTVKFSDDYIDNEEIIKKDKRKKEIKNYKDTKIYKIHKIYSSPEINTYKTYYIKNKDITYKNEKDEIKHILPPKSVANKDGYIDEKKLKKWQNEFAKDSAGDYIIDIKKITIKENKGLIDKNKPYKVEWCLIDTNNNFVFNNKIYHICDNVIQYQINNNNKYKMDKILVYYQNNNIYFFDEEINRIDNQLINEVGEKL